MGTEDKQRPPLGSPQEFNSEGTMSLPNPATGALTGRLPSPGITVDLYGDPSEPRPSLAPHLSAPAAEPKFQSPIRQHKRTPSQHREIKETLDARSEYTEDIVDGHPHHIINQYVIKEEIGRGSYGAVHLAADQFGNEFAVKEFSKARLRKRVQSNILRQRGPGGRLPLMPGPGLGLHRSARMSDQQAKEAKDALFLIREEVAIMKKLDHPNLVSLLEVLDDPEEDSLYMVLEMCKKGVVMKVGLDDPADPYSAEMCRCWFRDLILGIEYLHAQGVVHRDIKPDNLLLTEDDVLKISDFGVSEMFDRTNNMRTTKSAGSPAFLPPELCVAKHGDVCGKAADIWSMGVSLYCLRYGRIPFEQTGILDMYEAIRNDSAHLPPDEEPDIVDLLTRILEKDPDKRITMEELREHPWVTKDGHDPLLSAEENCAEPIDMPNALEVNHAFTRKMTHLLCVMKAISKFKSLLTPKGVVAKPYEPMPKDTKTEVDQETSQAPQSENTPTAGSPTPTGQEKPAATSADRTGAILQERERFFTNMAEARSSTGTSTPSSASKGHAHTLSPADAPFLGIGTGHHDNFEAHSGEKLPSPADKVVSESPTAVHFNIYDRAFEAEVDKIKRSTSRKGKDGRKELGPLYKTKHLKEGDRLFKDDEDVTWAGEDAEIGKDNGNDEGGDSAGGKLRMVAPRSGPKFADLVSQAVRDARMTGVEAEAKSENRN